MSIHTFEIDHQLVVFRPADKRLFILNPTATWIWHAMAQGIDHAEIIHLLADHYSLPVEDTDQEVLETIVGWEWAGLDPRQTEPGNDNSTLTSGGPEKAAVPYLQPADDEITYQGHYYFGDTCFTLTDYTSEFTSHFEPLLSSLAAENVIDGHTSGDRIDISKNGNEFIISCNGVELERATNELIVVGLVVQTFIDRGFPGTRWMSFIHAAAGSLDNRGFVFAGIGGSGKSTLMATLVKSGWTYWSDDTVPLDVTGKMGAVPLSLCLKKGSWDILTPYYPDLAGIPVYQRYDKTVRYLQLDVPQADGRHLQPVHGLIFPRYSPGSKQNLEALMPVAGLRHLVEAQSWISDDPECIEEMIRWISTIPIYKLSYSSLDWAAGKLRNLVRTGRS